MHEVIDVLRDFVDSVVSDMYKFKASNVVKTNHVSASVNFQDLRSQANRCPK